MPITLEEHLKRVLERGAPEGHPLVKGLRNQIAAKNSGMSAQELYVTGSVKKADSKKKTDQE